MRSACPVPKRNDFQRDCPIKTFLARAINHTLGAASDLSLQLVIAEVSRNVCSDIAFTISISKLAESGLKQAQTTKAPRRFGQNCSSTFGTDFCCHFLGLTSRVVSLYCPKFGHRSL